MIFINFYVRILRYFYLKVNDNRMNYLIVGFVILLAIALLVFLIVKNQRDKKRVLEQMNQMELKAEKHKEVEPEG